MRFYFYSLLLFLYLVMVAGCTSNQTSSIDKESFPTEKEAFTHFIQKEKATADVEKVQTLEGDELYVVRSGNHQYGVYGMAKLDDRYSLKKLTATMSLHNTISGGFEFTSSTGKEYTMLAAKQLEGLDYSTTLHNEFHKIFSEDAHIAISKGHTLGQSVNERDESVIQTTETVQSNAS
ncbi:hypothetical protein [Halobacillus litoralis]|uniref:DUF4825 domain-containing protein n=1 Tax=Halobacillus litoralis TaxID=45668 RepID=A0A410M9L9_9BACI|nr:hypothetical protein [Halobacillus litoralis]QAS51387.1 hypothetical protein HLI_03720 [Halobacillus litoralis]